MAVEVFEDVLQRWDALNPLIRGLVESVLVVLLAIGLRVAILSLVHRQTRDSRVYYTWRNGTQYFFSLFALTMIVSIWFSGTKDVATFFGLLTAGIAVSLKDPLSNIVGWGYILWQRPFSVGDRVEIDDVVGDVVDQRIFSFTMLEVGKWVHGEQSTGRVLHMPNAQVFGHALYNYTEPFHFIWDELLVTVSFESEWRRAKEMLLELACKRAESIVPEARAELELTSRRTLIHYHNLDPIVYTEIDPNGVTLVVRYLTHVRKRRAERQALWEGILDGFADEEGIHFAVGQRVGLHHESDPPRPRPHRSSPSSHVDRDDDDGVRRR